MSELIAGIDPHRDTFTMAIITAAGVEVVGECFDNTASGYCDLIELLAERHVEQVGVEGSGSWGSHVAAALVSAGFDTREVPPQRSAAQRRARRSEKTDHADAVATARALLADPRLGPVQILEIFDPVVAEIEAVLEHRRIVVNTRQLAIHQVASQIEKLPTIIRDQLDMTSTIEKRLNQLAKLDTDPGLLTSAARVRLAWLQNFAETDRNTRRHIRQLEADLDTLLNTHGTTLRDEIGIGTINAATLLCEVGDPTRFSTESRFAKWCGTGAVALSSGEGPGQPKRHRLDTGGNRRINSVLYIASVTQQTRHPEANAYLQRKHTEGKTKREARRSHKRHLANRVIRRMWKDHHTQTQTQTPQAA